MRPKHGVPVMCRSFSALSAPAAWLIQVEHCSRRECRRAEDSEVERVAEIPEDRFAPSEHDGLNHDRVLVDESGPGERLRESGASPGDDLTAGLVLQHLNLRGQIAAGDG